MFPQKPPLKILFSHESFLKEAGKSTHFITEIRAWSLCHQPLCAGLPMPRALCLDAICSQGLFARLLKGKLRKRSVIYCLLTSHFYFFDLWKEVRQSIIGSNDVKSVLGP